MRGDNSMPYYPTVDMCCDIVDWQEKMHYIDDALGMCAGLSSFPLKPPYHIHNYPKFISAGTGMEMDEEKLTEAVKRYRTLVRANNIRRGMRRKDEKPPDNHWKKRFPELEARLIAGLVRRDLPYYDATISPQTVGQMNRFARTMGILDSEVAYEDVVATSLQALWTPPITR